MTLSEERLKRKFEKEEAERKRVQDLFDFDSSYGEGIYLAGVDEVGRGPLAGPIVAASVILDLKDEESISKLFGINDSKKLSPKKRESIALTIKDVALAYSIEELSPELIDMKGISWCNNEVMKKACEKLSIVPDLVLSDGYAVKGLSLKNSYVIKGDAKSASIAAASIIAKVYRDSLMAEYSIKFPQYGFERNSGYGTKEHTDAIRNYGPCEIHRRSFIHNFI